MIVSMYSFCRSPLVARLYSINVIMLVTLDKHPISCYNEVLDFPFLERFFTTENTENAEKTL